MDSHTILVGHALHYDLAALGIQHSATVDSAVLAKAAVGKRGGREWGLKTLCKELLNTTIQDHGGRGHDAVEDALAAREVVLWCLKHGEELKAWGERKKGEVCAGAGKGGKRRNKIPRRYERPPQYSYRYDSDDYGLPSMSLKELNEFCGYPECTNLFCEGRSYLKVPGTTTITTTTTPIAVTSTTSTTTVSVTSAACPPAFKRTVVRDIGGSRISSLEDVEKRTNVLALLGAFAAAKISEGCSCLNLQPTLTTTATLAAAAPTVNVVATTTHVPRATSAAAAFVSLFVVIPHHAATPTASPVMFLIQERAAVAGAQSLVPLSSVFVITLLNFKVEATMTALFRAGWSKEVIRMCLSWQIWCNTKPQQRERNAKSRTSRLRRGQAHVFDILFTDLAQYDNSMFSLSEVNVGVAVKVALEFEEGSGGRVASDMDHLSD
ncbi:hypothetical protein OPT61_g9589 [Boeremia exigua]|uniref:Uncharacterized protein n=1 Tax=Boeremia exigua TaxID=749465 RepID=A0ACC2HTS8_9PLEO|nr:hypothetical protein OPT61_g9589 [Boeremia exigua]